jgi:hypothetical protein
MWHKLGNDVEYVLRGRHAVEGHHIGMIWDLLHDLGLPEERRLVDACKFLDGDDGHASQSTLVDISKSPCSDDNPIQPNELGQQTPRRCTMAGGKIKEERGTAPVPKCSSRERLSTAIVAFISTPELSLSPRTISNARMQARTGKD